MSPAFEFNQLMEEIHKTAVEKGWWENEDRNFGELIALCHSELSEAFEEYRDGHDLKEIYFVNDKPEGVPIELADILIRLFDFCYHLDLPLYEAMLIKMKFNEGRPYRHGGKKA